MSIFTKLFSGGVKDVIDSVSSVVDKFVTTPDEKIKMNQELTAEVNRHFEAMETNALKLFEAEVADKASARGREAEFVKSTGHIDWMMAGVGGIVMLSFVGTVYFVATQKMPEGSEHLLINAMGILEGMVLSVVGYYFGSSAGSRIKDMKK